MRNTLHAPLQFAVSTLAVKSITGKWIWQRKSANYLRFPYFEGFADECSDQFYEPSDQAEAATDSQKT